MWIAVGDRFVEVEAPDHVTVDPDAIGTVLVDGARRIEISVLTVTPKGPDDHAPCTRFVLQDGGRELRPGLACRIETDEAHEHWKLGWGNRIVYLSWTPAPADRTVIEAIACSVRETHSALPPVEVGKPVIRPLTAAQRASIERVASRLERRCGAVTLELLDEYWQALLADPSSPDHIGIAIDELGVAVGIELARTRHRFDWSVVTDAWGTTIAVVAYPGTRDVVFDPFNFVAKRWNDRAAPFFVATLPQLIGQLGRLAP
jgi:hypothetical protein